MGQNCAAVKSVVVWTRRRREKMPTKKKAAAVPAAIKAKIAANTVKEPTDPRFVREPKNFGIGNDMMPKTPLNRYVKWPKYVRIQRQRQVLKKRLRVPPAINQFTKTLDKNMATNLFKMLMKYRPEDNAQKKERLTDMAKDAAEGKESDVKKPVVVKYGINHKKTATALALTAVKQEDKMELSKLVGAIKASYNDKAKEHQRKWGGSIMGVKSQAKTAKRLKKMSKELGGESK